MEIGVKMFGKSLKNPRQLSPKWYQIFEKSSSGAVLEHFGDPLGAKMAQDRHQEQKNMKDLEFWGGLGGPK